MARARKIQRFLTQPFYVGEAFTGRSGKYVTLAETIEGFGKIISGEMDGKREEEFYMRGAINELTD